MAEGRKWIEKYDKNDEVPGQKKSFQCGPCKLSGTQTPADVFCSTCDEFQCTKCSNVHNVYTYMRSHSLVNAKDLKSKPVSYDMKGLDQCEQHQELLKFLCEDEATLCCNTCAIANHRKCHSVVEIEKIACQQISARSPIKTRLKELKAKAEMTVTHSKRTKEQLRRDVDDLPEKIQHIQEKVNKMFEELKAHVSREAEGFRSQTDAILSNEQSASEKLIAAIENYSKSIEDVCEKGTPSQQLIVEHKVREKVRDLQREIEGPCRDLKFATVSFDFHETMEIPPRPISECIPGQLTFQFASKTPPVNQTVRENPSMKLEKIASIDLKQTGDNVKEPLFSGLDFLSDGRLATVDNENRNCLLYNARLEKVGSYKLSYYPQSVVGVSDEEIAITRGGGYKLEFLRVSKSNVITPIRTCEVKTKYASISMKDEENFVLGTIDDTRPERVVSMSGEEKDFSISFPNKKYAIDTSACTYIKNSDQVVLTDRHEHTVYIHDIATNTRVDVKDERIRSPRGVTEGPAGSTLVCSRDTNSLVQIATTGKILASFMLDMKYPFRVAMSKNRSMLAVSNNCIGESKVQLFKLIL